MYPVYAMYICKRLLMENQTSVTVTKHGLACSKLTKCYIPQMERWNLNSYSAYIMYPAHAVYSWYYAQYRACVCWVQYSLVPSLVTRLCSFSLVPRLEGSLGTRLVWPRTIVPDLFSKLKSDWSVYDSFSDLFRVRGRAKVRLGLGTY